MRRWSVLLHGFRHGFRIVLLYTNIAIISVKPLSAVKIIHCTIIRSNVKEFIWGQRYCGN